MKPKNSTERRDSIIKFILLFLFTAALIVTAFFFDFDKVPLVENKILRESSATIKKEMLFQKEFAEGMKEVKGLLDSLDIPGGNIEHINALTNNRIVALQGSIPDKDSTYRYDMYQNIIKGYVDIQEYKRMLKDLERLKDCEEKLDRCVLDLNSANEYLDSYRRR